MHLKKEMVSWNDEALVFIILFLIYSLEQEHIEICV